VARDNEVSSADLRTQGAAVSARSHPHSSKIDGYLAVYTLRLRVRQLSTAPLVIDAIAQAAGDALRLGSFDLFSADTAAARGTAAVNAIADARSRAEQLAQAAGVRLGPTISIVEGSPALHGQPSAMRWQHGHALASAAPPIQGGSDEIIAHVEVTFHIHDRPR
jgi:uncharacterized protein YggE